MPRGRDKKTHLHYISKPVAIEAPEKRDRRGHQRSPPPQKEGGKQIENQSGLRQSRRLAEKRGAYKDPLKNKQKKKREGIEQS